MRWSAWAWVSIIKIGLSLFWEIMERRFSADFVLKRLVAGSKSKTESMIAASRDSGSATMYCKVAVIGSNE